MNYEKFSEQLLEAVGGPENITHVTNCATRLRVSYKRKSLVNDELLKTLPGSQGIVNKQGQVQVIVGPTVGDAYNDFLKVSKWDPTKDLTDQYIDEDTGPKNIGYWANKFGNFVAPIFMPIVPALITGGLILAIKNLLVNYFGVATDSGTATVLMAIFEAAFYFLPIYVGYTFASQLKLQPIMGAFVGALLITPSLNGVEGLDFFGIGVATPNYSFSIFPVILGVTLLYFVDKFFKKIIPESLIYTLKPILTMLIVAPITLIALAPIGTFLSGTVANFVLWVLNNLGILAMPILAVLYPYMVMFGVDKALMPIGIELLPQLGYEPFNVVMGFISNIAIGATALAIASSIRENKQRGLVRSFGITALFGITEPAFYGSIISRPLTLVGTALGAAAAGLTASLIGLKSFVMGGAPGLLSLLFFVDGEGSLTHVIYAVIVAAVAIAVTYIATKFILSKYVKKERVLEEQAVVEEL